MNPTDMAVLSVIGHGGITELRKAGFSWEWMEKGDAQTVVKEAMTLDLQGQPVNITNVMLRIKVTDWQPVLQAWTDGYGSTAVEAAIKCRSEHVRRQVGMWLSETERLAKSSSDVSDWWPKQVMLASQLSSQARNYSPNAIDLAKRPIPKVTSQFESSELNKIFSGGVWKPATTGIVSYLGGGKTTMAVTVAANLCASGIKNLIFSAERQPQWYVYRVMRNFGFSKEEFERYVGHKDGTDRCNLFWDYLQTVSTCLFIYDSTFMEAAKMEHAISVERPEVVQVDHILAMRLEKSNNESYAIGRAAYQILDMTNKYSCMSILYGQLNGKDSETFKTTHNLSFTNYFGSTIVAQSLVIGLLTCKHWAKPDTQWFIKKKNSADESGEIDDEYTMRYDKQRAVYIDEEKGETNEIVGGY